MAPAKKSTVAASSAPVAEPPAPAKVVLKDNTEEPTLVESDVDKYDVVIEKLHSLVNDAKEMITTVKFLKKENQKTQKLGNKRQRKVNTDGTKRPASGITKPTKLSKDLCEFLGVPEGTSLARTEVTKIINTYIKDNGLQDKEDRRTIHPDNKLKKILLPIPADKKLSFFNMQSFIKHQFIK